MRKIFTLLLSFIVLFGSVSFLALPLYAQEDEMVTTDDWDYDWDYEWDSDFDSTTNYDGLSDLIGAGLVVGSVMLVFALVLSLGLYIYSSLALMTLAKRLDQENTWFAWVPILNMVLLYRMGDMNPLLILIVLIPGLGAAVVGIISIIALMNICEKRGYDKLLGLLALIPLANLILLGVLAWGNRK